MILPRKVSKLLIPEFELLEDGMGMEQNSLISTVLNSVLRQYRMESDLSK